jgi:hypothetical protein
LNFSYDNPYLYACERTSPSTVTREIAVPDLPEDVSPETFAATVEARLKSRRDYAAQQGFGERKLDRMIASRVIPVVRIGTSVLIDVVGARAAMAAEPK